MDIQTLLSWFAYIVLAASLLHALLPPYDWLDDFPRAQKFYKTLLALIQHIALNSRKNIVNLYPSVQQKVDAVGKQDVGTN